MDPALQELMAEGAPEEEVAVVVRFNPKALPPAGLRIVARFGPVATARVARADIRRIHGDPAIVSLKSARDYSSEIASREVSEPEIEESDPDPEPTDVRRPPGLGETGRGTVLAVIDWGCDFAHPDFRNDDGSTRLIALWDQRGGEGANPYGYGCIHGRAAIDRALAAADPFAELGYRPGLGIPAHGTHVLGIAGGNGRAGGPAGVAPEADLLFVHLGAGGGELGSSVELLEALHFAAKAAGTRPLSVNLSIGRHGGQHDGTLLIERAIDWLLVNRPGTAIAQSTGNYHNRDIHMSGALRERVAARLPFRLGRRDRTPVVVEIWYAGADEFDARVSGPGGAAARAPLGGDCTVRTADGREVGHIYHRREDPNNGDNLVNLFLYEAAASGLWEIEIEGLDVVDGRWHAWIERNAGCRECQAQFVGPGVDPRSTNGSISNALRTIAVGAYDAHDPDGRLAPFSSVGPTRDGRRKPLLVAPGVRILSVRSRADPREPAGYVRMSGTSMASPHVAGVLALMMQAAGRQKVATLRQLLFSTLKPAPDDDPRWGYGRLDVAAAVAAARQLAAGSPPPASETLPEFEAPPAAALPAGEAEQGAEMAPPADPLVRRFLAPAAPAAPGWDPAALLRRAADPDDRGAVLIGAPGRRLAAPLAAGDIVVRSGPSGPRQASSVRGPGLLRRRELAALGLLPEGPWAGLYVSAQDGAGGEPFAQRVAGADGFLLPGISIVRLRAPHAHAAAPREINERPIGAQK
jgi:subtilisin family serine protease